jgi:hypothetical protein
MENIVYRFNTTECNFETNLTEVYNGPYKPIYGNNLHELSTPFYWNGVDNLLVEIAYDNAVSTSKQEMAYTYNNTSDIVMIANYSNSILSSRMTSTTTTFYAIPYTYFAFSDAIPLLSAPTQNIYSVNLDVGDSRSLGFSNISGGVIPYSYQWQSSTDNDVFTSIAGATSTTLLIVNNNNYTERTTIYYKVLITDAVGSSVSVGPYIINYLAPVSALIQSDGNIASENSTLSALVLASEGTGAYTYEWFEVLEDGTLVPITSDAYPYIFIDGANIAFQNDGSYLEATSKKYKCIVKNL